MYFICTLHMEQLDGEPLPTSALELVEGYLNEHCTSDDNTTRFLREPSSPDRSDTYAFCCTAESSLWVGWWSEEFHPTCKRAMNIAYEAMVRALKELTDIKIWVEIQQIPEG